LNIVIEQIELQAKLLNYFLGSNKSNINQTTHRAVRGQPECNFSILGRNPRGGFLSIKSGRFKVRSVTK